MEDYICQSGHKIVSKMNKRTHYVICNNQEELSAEEQNKIEKAKELEIPILSEIEFIATYGEQDYFKDFVCEDTWGCFRAIEPDSLIYESFSFEDFCKYYKVDDTITEDVFQQKKESDDRIQVSLSKKASIGDLRETEVYYIDEAGIIRDADHNIDNKMMVAVKKWEEKFS